jgi:hypothetical protein
LSLPSIDLSTVAEILVAAGTLSLAFFTYLSVKESAKVRKSQFDVNLDLFVEASTGTVTDDLNFRVVNYGPGVAKDIVIDYKPTRGAPADWPKQNGAEDRASAAYLAPKTPSGPNGLFVRPHEDVEISFTISYTDLLGNRKTLKGKVSRAADLWNFVPDGGAPQLAKNSKNKRAKVGKTVIALWLGTIAFALFSLLPYQWAWNDLSKPTLLPAAEFFTSIAFAFDFAAFGVFFVGLSEYRADGRMAELRSLLKK